MYLYKIYINEEIHARFQEFIFESAAKLLFDKKKPLYPKNIFVIKVQHF